MVELKVYLSETVNEKFRRTAMNVYGYGRGSLSKAAEEAFAEWCTRHDGEGSQSSSDLSAEARKNPTEAITSKIDPDERQNNKAEAVTQDHSSEPLRTGS